MRRFESSQQRGRGLKNHKCESCDRSFARAGSLKIHIHTVHENHKDYKCESCSKSFSQAGSLKRHIHIVHEGYKDYKCESCGKSFSEAGYLKNTPKQFMKATKSTIVDLVRNHFLKHKT